MASIINYIAFKNFYNFYGDYSDNRYDFKEGLNIINADNGMGKSKMFNGFLWILQDMVYDSDTRRKETVANAAMKMLSEKAKSESSPECGVQIVFGDESDQYTITKSIKYTQTFDANEPWKIAPVVTEVMVTNLITHNTSIVYDINRQNEIIKERLISPAMLSYSLLQGEAIDKIQQIWQRPLKR